MMNETTTEPTTPGYYWARRDGSLEGECIRVETVTGKLEALTWGDTEYESLHAFFLFYGPVENPIAVGNEGPR